MTTPLPPRAVQTPDAARRPRVLGGDLASASADLPAGARLPRAIGGGESSGRAGGAAAQESPALPRTPHAIPPGTPQPATVAASAPTATPVAPRHIPGQLRVGLKVGADALARRFPEQEARVLDAAAGVLGTVVPESFGWPQAQNVGLDAQKQYGVLVQRLLEASSSSVLRTAPQHLSRLLGLLETCAEDFDPPTGLVGQWLRKDRPRAIDTHRREIEQLRTTLSASVGDLDSPIAEVMGVREKLAALADALVAASLACDWLAATLPLPDEVSGVLAERALSLTKTAAMVRQQQQQSLASASNMDALRDRIQEGVLIALPGWLASLANRPPQLNDTQRFVVRDELRQIIHRLKY